MNSKNTRTHFLTSILCTVALCAGTAAWAQAAKDMADGEIRKIDKDAKKVTIQHGEIKSLDMPPMTMVFTVKDPALLEKVKPGDKVKFAVSRDGARLVVTSLQATN
jgi:Cu(I)/Ag(I) efflux system protein CusF